ncbi:MAG: AMP-binding protein [Clostridia bacterium]|nr:AMP-binding protein [Clostridia bacterium]MDR3643577.1 AMP-binding protein [Clostridia bacterium]
MSELISITVGGLLDDVAARYPDDEAVAYIDRPYRRTWREFNEECDRVAKGLYAIGIRKGDHVAIWATNVPEWLISFFAVAKIGAVFVTVNSGYKIFEAEYLLRQSDSKALVMIDGFKDSNYIEIINSLCPTLAQSEPGRLECPMLPRLQHVIHVGQESKPGMLDFSALEKLGESVSDGEYASVKASLSPQDVVNMQYTSGTTGFPKGVMLTHVNIVNNGKTIGDGMNFTHADKLCIPVPFFHCFGMVLAIMASVTHATAMVPLEYYQPLMVMQAIQDEGCTAVHGVPTMFIAMLEHPRFHEFRFPKMRTGIMAGSPCPIKVMQQVVDQMGMREIVIVYGQTEASPGCTMTTTFDSIEQRVNTVGRVMPGVEAKIIDPATGLELPCDQPGEFCARGYNLMRGYYNMPEATAQAIDSEGWLHSGDLASVDEKGYYKIRGRIKDMIIRGGENIYPKEIEDFLYTYPAVKDVQVIGVPSHEYGEEIAACVILREGSDCTAEELQDYVRTHMARHKTPKYVLFMDEFPMTASGKIMKFKMREDAAKKLGLQEETGNETV